jgi:hypothetical protein
MPAGAHRLVLDFTADGGVDFHATTDDPQELAQRLARVIRTLVEHPTAIGAAAGVYHGLPHAE